VRILLFSFTAQSQETVLPIELPNGHRRELLDAGIAEEVAMFDFGDVGGDELPFIVADSFVVCVNRRVGIDQGAT
jgi:hypothetical protein